MSIVALQRNSRRFIDPISSGPTVFSLNGGRRNIGQVGPTDLGTYTNKYGAACACTSNDSTIIKRSVMNTRGMLTSRNLCTNPGDKSCHEFWVTPMGPEHFSQGTYIQNKMSKNSALWVDKYDANIYSCCNNITSSGNSKPWLNRKQPSSYTKNLPVAISSSEYLKGKLMKKNCLPPCRSKDQHFPMYRHNSQNALYLANIEQAKDSGLIKDCCPPQYSEGPKIGNKPGSC